MLAVAENFKLDAKLKFMVLNFELGLINSKTKLKELHLFVVK
jgi:hypothetical protein